MLGRILNITQPKNPMTLLVLSCVWILWIFAPALAQDQNDDLIESIKVVGNQRIEYSTITSYLLFDKGSKFDPIFIDQSLKKLFATGFFSDVAIAREGQILIVNVVENPIINRIVFEGNKRIKDSTLEAEMNLRPRVVYTLSKVQKDLVRLLQLYRNSGRFSARIEPRIIALEQNRIDLVYEINEGNLTGIQRVLFVGNNNFSNSKLREIIRTKETRWWRFLSSDDTYDPDRINYDGELLRRFYVNQGYADFQVKSSISELTGNKEGFFVTFVLDEGKRYKISAVTLNTTLPDFDVTSLGTLVATRQGDWYNSDTVEATVQKLTDEIGERGRAFVEVLPRVQRDRANSLISLTYDIGEGERVYVERVEISGNVRTLDRVIRRNVRLAEGDAFSPAKIRRSKQLIEELGFFSNVDIRQLPGSTPDRSEIHIGIQEQSTGELAFGAGLSSDSGVLASVGITEKNLLGRGQNVSLQLQLSGRDQIVEASLDEPYFLNRDVSAGFDIYDTRREFRESSFNRELFGFGVRASYPVAEFLHQQIRYGLRSETIVPFSDASNAIKSNQGESVVSTLGQSIFYKKLDNKLRPKDGYFVGLTSDVAGLGGDRKWLKNKIEAGFYEKLWSEDWIGSLVGEVAFIAGLSGQKIAIADRFFLGGQNFRGFKIGGIGPRDLETGTAIGGNLLYTATAQMTVPIGLPKELGISGKAFTTIGSLMDVDESNVGNLGDTGSLRAAIGVGILWESPFGPVSLNYARPVSSEDFDETEFISFGIGSLY